MKSSLEKVCSERGLREIDPGVVSEWGSPSVCLYTSFFLQHRDLHFYYQSFGIGTEVLVGKVFQKEQQTGLDLCLKDVKKRNRTTLWVRLLKIGIFWKVINFFNFLLDSDVQPSTRKAGLCGTFTQQLMNTALAKTAQFRARFGCRMPGLLQPKVKHHGEVLRKWQSFITWQTGLTLGLTSQKIFWNSDIDSLVCCSLKTRTMPGDQTKRAESFQNSADINR